MQRSDFNSPRQPWTCSLSLLCLVCTEHSCFSGVCVHFVCVFCMCVCVLQYRTKDPFVQQACGFNSTNTQCVLHVFSCMLICAANMCVFSRSVFIRRDLSLSSVCLCPSGAQLSPRAGLTLGLLLSVRPHSPLCPLATIHQTSAAANANPPPDSSFKQLHQCCHEGNILNLIQIQEKKGLLWADRSKVYYRI